jgi:hypothetical protein
MQLIMLVVIAYSFGADSLDSLEADIRVFCRNFQRPEPFDGDVLQTFQRETGHPNALMISVCGG